MLTLKLPVLPQQSDTRTQTCSCGHDREAHAHLRAGTDCCGCECRRFSVRRPLPR